MTALSPTVTIQDFFDAPVVNRDWRVTSVDPELVRFGLLWKLYDLIAEKGLDFRVPILESKPGNWLLGGTSGTSFLVQPLGLDCLCVQSIILFYSLPTLYFIQEEQLPSLSWL